MEIFQPGLPNSDGWGTWNEPLFRSADLYLMAAEAIVKGATGAKLGTADVYYNIVLDRALASNSGKSPARAQDAANLGIFLPMWFPIELRLQLFQLI